MWIVNRHVISWVQSASGFTNDWENFSLYCLWNVDILLWVVILLCGISKFFVKNEKTLKRKTYFLF